jgi:hypothetical protein
MIEITCTSGEVILLAEDQEVLRNSSIRSAPAGALKRGDQFFHRYSYKRVARTRLRAANEDERGHNDS